MSNHDKIKKPSKGGGEVMPQTKKSSYRRQKRVLRFHFLIHGLYKNLRVDHQFDDYQRIEEVT